MKFYYHFYPVCPVCLTPFRSDGSEGYLERKQESSGRTYYVCSFCNNKFYADTDIFMDENKSIKFEKTLNHLKEMNENESFEKIKRIPVKLFWKIRLNIIESDLIEWAVKDFDRGIFLISWPWEKVKIIPVMINEYLNANRDRKVLIITEENNYAGEDKIKYPTISEIWKYISFLEDSPDDSWIRKRDILKEKRSFQGKYILKKRKRIEYKVYGIENIKNKIKVDEGYCESEPELKKKLKNNFEIEKIKTRDSDKKNIKIWIDGKEKFEIHLKVEKYTPKKIKYKAEYLWEIFWNIHQFKKLDYNRIEMLSNRNFVKVDDTKNIFIINMEGTNNEDVIKKISYINADLIVISDAEKFFIRNAHDHEKNNMEIFFRHLASFKDKKILIFSVNRDLRFRTWNKLDEILQNSKINFTKITYDRKSIIDKFRQLDSNESDILNPLSSMWEEMDEFRKPEVEYITLYSLDDLLQIKFFVEKMNLSETFIKKIDEYFKELTLSLLPLRVRDNYSGGEAFSINIGDSFMNYDNFLSTLYGDAEKNKSLEETKNILTRIFGNLENPENPLFKMLNEQITRIINENTYITVALRKSKFSELSYLRNYFDFNYNKSDKGVKKIYAEFWKDLKWREYSIPENSNHVVIALSYPDIEYRMTHTDVKKFIFIGSNKNIEKIKNFMDNYLYEINLRPIEFVKSSSSVPDRYREISNILQESSIPNDELINELNSEIRETLNLSSNYQPDENYKAIRSYYLNSGEMAYLLIDDYGNGIFIPSGSSLMLTDGNFIEEIQLDNLDAGVIEGKYVLLDRNGLYISFKPVFFKYMMILGKKINFKKGDYEWKGFNDLYKDSIKWIDHIGTVIKFLTSSGQSYEMAENKVANILSNMNLTARNPEYIKKWWNSYETVDVDGTEYRVYRTEHTKRWNDLEQIYKGLKDRFPEVEFTDYSPLKTFIASKFMQELRKNFLKGKVEKNNEIQVAILNNVKEEIIKIIDRSKKFNIRDIKKVKIINEVEAYKNLKIIDMPENFNEIK